MGRIYAASIDNADDRISKQDAMGLPLAIDKRLTDPSTLKTIAMTKFQNPNCGLIR